MFLDILAVVDQRPAKGFPSSDPFDDENTEAGMWISTSNVALRFISGAGRRKFKDTPSKAPAEVKGDIFQILDQYRPKMNALVAKAGRQPLLPTWIPKERSGSIAETDFEQHVKELAIPNVRGAPSLLLHDLGSAESVIDTKQEEHVANIFSLHNHTWVGSSDSLPLANLNIVESSSTLLALVKLASVYMVYVSIGDSMLSLGEVRTV